MSFRMSKDLAHTIADQLTKNKSAEIKKLEAQFEKEIVAEYAKQIPASIRRMFKKFPGYFRTTTQIRIHAAGFNYKYVSFKKELPEHNSERGVKLDAEQATYFKKLDNNIELLQEKVNNLHKEITAALIGLNSFAKIQKDFPEAVPFIPVSTSQALMIDMDKLRERIKTA